MKDAAITYGGLCVPQGQTKHGNAPILDTGYSMPITVVNGAFDGPTMRPDSPSALTPTPPGRSRTK